VGRLRAAMAAAGWPLETIQAGVQRQRVRLTQVARDAAGTAYLRLTAPECAAVANHQG
jgi:hypothetical protein